MRPLIFILFTVCSHFCLCQVSFNFEAGALNEWLQIPDNRWQASNSSPIVGIYSLKHTFNNSVSAIDRISTPLPDFSVENGDITWRFKIRHGYDPSSSNCWWVYLMSNLDANSMGNPSIAEGYIVGVNFTGSDDLLKIWKLSGGLSQIILTSDLNWQNLVGTTGIGAIEVTRSWDGIFSLYASINGDFSNLQSYGSTLDNELTAISFFGICYKYSSSADQLLWADDISIFYQQKNIHDPTSEAASPVSQIPTGEISSLDTSATQNREVLKFVIRDIGSGDNLSTLVKRLAFKQGEQNNQASWNSTIGGIKLIGPSGNVTINKTAISEKEMELEIDTLTMIIPDGADQEFTMGIYLNNKNLVDNSILSFCIDSSNHGFEAGLSGSAFASTFSRKIYSSSFTIGVDATKLSIADYPSKVGLNKPFSVIVKGTDTNNNCDNEFNNNITLSVGEGEGILSSSEGLTKTAVNGVAQWNDLSYSASGSFTLRAESVGYDIDVSDYIDVVNDSSAVVVAPLNQTPGAAISSIINYPSEAKEVFRFRLADLGSGDGQPAYISSIKLTRNEIPNIASLSKSIQGVIVKANGNLIGSSTPEIKNSSITIPFDHGALTIPDGTSIEVAISVYLKDAGLIDNQLIQLKIDNIDHGFSSYPDGSAFQSNFPQIVTSNIFVIAVDAKKLNFTEVPKRVGVSEPFNITVSATDDNNNTDKDFTGDISLSLANGEGQLTIPSGSIGRMFFGELIYQLLTYDHPGNFSLLITNPDIDDALSPIIFCGDEDAGAFSEDLPKTKRINSTSTSAQNAIEIFRLKVYDKGTSDEQPLIVDKIRLGCFKPNKTNDMAKIVDGFTLTLNGTPLETTAIEYSSDAYDITLLPDNFIIPDADTAELSISVYLRKGELKDNSSFQFYIPSSDHGWVSNSVGTSFIDEFPSTIYGDELIIIVDATNLTFLQIPFTTAYPETNTIRVASTDLYGNLDVDFEDDIMLELYSENVLISTFTPQRLQGGYVDWADIVLPKPGKYNLKASGIQLNEEFSEPVYCGINHLCSLNDDFETSINPEWIETSDWQTSTISPIYGKQSLQHKIQAAGGISELSIPFTFPTSGDKLLEWNFTIKSGDWNPSADNYFYFSLMSSTSNLSSSEASGYAIGINPKSGNDFLSLWQIVDGQNKTLITSDLEWKENDEVVVRVGYTTKGEWLLWYQTKNNNMVFAGTGHSEYSDNYSFCGLVFGYTASRSGELWIDNLSICISDYPPIIKLAKPINLTTTKVEFTELVNHSQATNKNNYLIKDLAGNPFNIQSIDHQTSSGKCVIINTDPLPFQKLKLQVNGVGDINGRFIKDSITFGLGVDGSIGQLIINEIMASPVPSVGLPEHEFVELYNPSNNKVPVESWFLQLNDKLLKLPADTVPPNGYVILCGSGAYQEMSNWGKAVAVSGFPALLNSGMLIKLYDPYKNLISFANYDDSWYQDEIKKDGGWSLEKIDYSNITGGKTNWRASVAAEGGTPGQKNSVVTTNPDNINPTTTLFEVLSDHELMVGFSEPMDTLQLTYSKNYSIDNGVGNPKQVSMAGELFDMVILSFDIVFNADQVYNLCIKGDIKDFSGNFLNETFFTFSLPQIPQQNDIIINEVLFNPFVGGVDFVEIYNRSDKWVDLSGLKLGNRNPTTNQLNEINAVSDTSKLLPPGEYIVITTDPLLVSNFYYVDEPSAFISVPKIASLNIDKGSVVLLNENFDIVDEMSYSEEMHFKLLTDVKGVSLEKINPDLPSKNSASWHSAAQSAGFATPTYRNSQYHEKSKKDEKFSFSPEVFSPNGDGKDDFLTITYKLPGEGYSASINIFDSFGVEVRKLVSNQLMGTEGTIVWDGLVKNQKAPVGIYIVFIECFNLKGDVIKLKKTCVVAE